MGLAFLTGETEARGGQTCSGKHLECAQASHFPAPSPDPGTGANKLSAFPCPLLLGTPRPQQHKDAGPQCMCTFALFLSMLSNTQEPTGECGAGWEQG